MRTPCLRLCTLATLCCLSVLFSAGCSYISFHDSKTSRSNTGVEYYSPRLFLLITQTETGKYTSQILKLPDLANPKYARLHPGYGKNTLSLKLTDGMITEVGQTTDTQVPETITAAGSLVTATAAAIKKLRVQDTARNDSGGSAALYEILMTPNGVTLRLVE